MTGDFWKKDWFLGLVVTVLLFAAGGTYLIQSLELIGLIGRGILPALALVAAFMTVAYKYGRLYCGWLCPHFSLVESLNDLLHRATGKLSLWDRHATPRAGRQPDKRWWPLFAISCAVNGCSRPSTRSSMARASR